MPSHENVCKVSPSKLLIVIDESSDPSANIVPSELNAPKKI